MERRAEKLIELEQIDAHRTRELAVVRYSKRLPQQNFQLGNVRDERMSCAASGRVFVCARVFEATGADACVLLCIVTLGEWIFHCICTAKMRHLIPSAGWISHAHSELLRMQHV